MPGRVFASPADFNTQLQAWLVRANHRQHRVLGCRPADRIEADTAAMLTLPPVGPSIGWRTSTRLPRDRFDIVGPPHHVEVEQRLLTTYDTVLGLDGPVA